MLIDQFEEIVRFVEKDKCHFLMKRIKKHHKRTYEHSLGVAHLALNIWREINFSTTESFVFLRSALLHDVGKLWVPNNLLDKISALSSDEVKQLRRHTQNGVDIVAPWFDSSEIDMNIILNHHENLDGTGYPHELNSSQLSQGVRIVRVVDSFDAMTGDRGYNKPKTKQFALEELYRWSDTEFDSEIVSVLHRILKDSGSRRKHL